MLYSETFRQTIANLIFAERGVEYLQNTSMLGLCGKATIDWGGGQDETSLEIFFGHTSWMMTPPRVMAYAPWLQPVGVNDYQSYADWHRYPNNELCWVRPDRWKKMLVKESADVERKAAFLVKNVTALLRYHLLADRFDLGEWQSSWDFDPHGSYKER